MFCERILDSCVGVTRFLCVIHRRVQYLNWSKRREDSEIGSGIAYRSDRKEILQTIMILKLKVSNPREGLGAST